MENVLKATIIGEDDNDIRVAYHDIIGWDIYGHKMGYEITHFPEDFDELLNILDSYSLSYDVEAWERFITMVYSMKGFD